MFTGIVECLGKVVSLRGSDRGRILGISPLEDGQQSPWKQAARLGESISVNGACLTVSRIGKGGREVCFDAVPETLSRTTLGRLRVGDHVNLERSLAVGDRLGGHFVTGHIDEIGTILSRKDEGAQVVFQIQAPPRLLEQMIPKGSVAVDGISLTVIDVDRGGGWFTFAAIPHTLKWSTLGQRRLRDQVNLEADALGKWILHGVREILGELPSLRGRSPSGSS